MKGTAISTLVEATRALGRGHMVVLTGAGISAASGLPVFRGQPDAIWEQDVMEMATSVMYHHDPVAWWEWFIRRFSSVRDARPNNAHRAIAGLERFHRARGGELTLITQNFDTLHEDAGSEDAIKVHGTVSRLRCSRDGCRNGAPFGSLSFEIFSPLEWARDPRRETLPRCEACGATVRAHILLFDEYYGGHADYRFAEAVSAFDRMDLLLVVGTSLAVGITHVALDSAMARGVPVFRIDRSDDGVHSATLVRGAAEQILPEMVAMLADPGSG
jgi:NAD-dependent SIR2 family protein deacetylase